MKPSGLEGFLARLYVDGEARSRFRADPLGAAAAAGLTREEAVAVAAADPLAVELAARSFAAKRERAAGSRRFARWWRLLFRR